ncbi:MAG: NAD(P)H-dependent glycerol-3-phosphate dehydrogenase, partial [Synechococcales cyanobacterium]
LSGLGDLLATCNSPLSRNYQVGYGLGQGASLTDILTKIEGTAEGVNTTNVLMTLAHQHHIYLPIVQQVYALLTGRLTPRQALESLMMRDAKPE